MGKTKRDIERIKFAKEVKRLDEEDKKVKMLSSVYVDKWFKILDKYPHYKKWYERNKLEGKEDGVFKKTIIKRMLQKDFKKQIEEIK